MFHMKLRSRVASGVLVYRPSVGDGAATIASAKRHASRAKKRDAIVTRGKILKAAMKEFAAKGLDARIEDIADMAGANRRMAYYYFGSKEGLYLAALEATYLELVRVERGIDVGALGPLEAIAALISAKFEHYVKYPHYVEFVKIENLYKARHLKTSKRIAEMRAPLIALIDRVLKKGQAEGSLKARHRPFRLVYFDLCAWFFRLFEQIHVRGDFQRRSYQC